MFHRPRRRPSTMRASIRTPGRDMTVDILDVSEAGMRLAVKGAFAEGQPVTVVTPRLSLPGIVMWQRGGELGLRLDRKLAPGEITELSGLSWGI